MDHAKNFDRRLKRLLDISGTAPEELARRLDVAVPVVNRWLHGLTAPDVYQFQAIAQLFGIPYAWFLDGGDGFPSAEELAARLGLTERTVECLMNLADERDENESVLDAVDLALQAVIAVAGAVWEDLDRYTDKAVRQAFGWKGAAE